MVLVQLLLYILLSALFTSLVEFVIHKYAMHSSFLGLFDNLYISHIICHHGKPYKFCQNKFLRRLPLFGFFSRYHYLHYLHPNKNFNVLFPIVDMLVGTYRVPNDSDVLKMMSLGLYKK